MKLFIKLLFLFFIIIAVVSCNREALSPDKLDGLFQKAEDASKPDDIRIAYLDSAYTILSQQNNDSITRHNYSRAAVDYYALQLSQKTLKVSKEAMLMARESNDTLNLASAYYIRGVTFYESGQKDSAFAYYRDAEKLYHRLGMEDNLARTILYKAHLWYDVNEFVLCETEAIRALTLLKKEGLTLEVYQCLNLLAATLDAQGNYDDAITYYEQALSQTQELVKEGYPENTVSYVRLICYNNIGLVYQKMARYDKAIDLFTKYLNQNPNLKEIYPDLYAIYISNLAYSKFKAGQRTEDVEDMLLRGLQIRDSINNEAGIVASQQSLGEYYLSSKDTAQAIDYFRSSYKLARSTNRAEDALNSLRFLSDVDKDKGYYYSDLYIKLNDSLQEKARQSQNRFARLEYETDQLIGEKEALAKKNSFIIGVSVVVLLFIAAIFIIYYLNSRNKELMLVQEQQKANEEIYQLMFEQQVKIDLARSEEKNRIAMELHDGILNNIYAVRLNLEFINKKSDESSVAMRKEYIKQLQGVESEIRSVSHELNRDSVLYGDQRFDNLLGFMITSQKNSFNTQFEALIDSDINWEQISNVTKVNIYRIIQEALQNINKYSEANHASVQVLQEGSLLTVIIADDGVGFDLDEPRAGIGLKNLQSRANTLKGTLTIKSEPGNGTKVELTLPV